MKKISSEFGTTCLVFFSIITLVTFIAWILEPPADTQHPVRSAALFCSLLIVALAALLLVIKFVLRLEPGVYDEGDALCVSQNRKSIGIPLTDHLQCILLTDIVEIRCSRFPIFPRIRITYLHHAVTIDSFEFLLTSAPGDEGPQTDIIEDLRKRVALAREKTATL